MSALRIPAGASLPPPFTARERATVDAYFGRANRARRQTIAWLRLQLMFPLVVALCVVTVAVSVGA